MSAMPKLLLALAALRFSRSERITDSCRTSSHVRFCAKFGLMQMHCGKSLKQPVGTGSNDGGEVGLP
jgi:hypothetical protein